ncbi:MAG: hypothetical protein IKH15_07710 [Bacteroidales bacterium]|nr:hypothetical protein [Bacteroidales bacterium]
MMTKLELEELEVLRYANVPEIPAAADEHTPVWIYAIAKILTTNAQESYAIVRMNYGRVPTVVKTFNDKGIGKIVSVHPYKFLDSNFVPKLENAAATKKYIAAAYGVSEEEVKKLKKEELLRLFYSHCIKSQLTYEKKQSDKLPL